jgi:hypothetical protein
MPNPPFEELSASSEDHSGFEGGHVSPVGPDDARFDIYDKDTNPGSDTAPGVPYGGDLMSPVPSNKTVGRIACIFGVATTGGDESDSGNSGSIDDIGPAPMHYAESDVNSLE